MILSKIIFHSLIFKSKQLETTPIMIPGDRINTLLCIYSIKYTVHPYRKYYAVIRKDEEALWGTLIGNDMWFAKWDGKWEKEKKNINIFIFATVKLWVQTQESRRAVVNCVSERSGAMGWLLAEVRVDFVLFYYHLWTCGCITYVLKGNKSQQIKNLFEYSPFLQYTYILSPLCHLQFVFCIFILVDD